MDLEKEKATVEQTEPTQSELELDFNATEPVTPKKPVTRNTSFLDKLKQYFKRSPNVQQEKAPENAIPEKENQAFEETAEDKIIPTKTNDWKKPETWAVLSILPQRHRRLFVVLFAFVLLLVIYFLLKPSSTTVTSLEQRDDNAIPIQFQPIDKNQEVQNTNEAAGLDQLVNQLQSQDNNTTVSINAEPIIKEQPVSSPAPSAQSEQVAPTLIPAVATTQPEEKQAEIKQQVITPNVVKAEKKPVVNKASTEKQNAKTEAKKAEQKNEKGTKTKVLTIPQGVSLMQVFRNQNLNIAEVNAMTKAKGANKALSNFKAGDKVIVSLNNKGNVVELQLQNGGKFIRQQDGSYIYKK